MKSPAFQFYPKDFLASPDVQMMDAKEVGAYCLLLFTAWEATDRPGHLPNDERKLQRWSRLSKEEWIEAREVLLEKFPVSLCGQYRYNPRLVGEALKQEVRRERLAENGRKGGRPSKNLDETNRKADDNLLVPEGKLLVPEKNQKKRLPSASASTTAFAEEKKIERECASELAADLEFFNQLDDEGNHPADSPSPGLRTPGGAADVPTSIVPAVDFTDISPALILPFQSDAFRAGWAKWRQYNHEELERPLGGGMREQEALRKCGLLSKQDEPVALAIIDQAISKGWKDLFPLDSSSPAFTPNPANPQRHAVNRSNTYGNQNSAAARLHTPKPTAEAGWGYPGQ